MIVAVETVFGNISACIHDSLHKECKLVSDPKNCSHHEVVLVAFNEGTPFQGFSPHHYCNQTITNCLFVIYIRKKDET